MRILGLIPARGGSKGIPGKNIKLLGGYPLLKYTIDSANRSEYLSRLIISSDDQSIIEVAKSLNLEVPFVRPKGLAEDATPTITVLKHALNFFSANGEYYDAVCLLQPTTPFRGEGLIDEAIEKFKKGDYDSLISVREIPIEFNPHWAFEDHGGTLKMATGEGDPIARRQELPKAYHRDGAIYLTKSNVILKNDSLFGNKIGYVDTTHQDYVNLDTIEDWIKAEDILKNRN
jgi:CMP-N,N'-diacetyllegionaminic acid synthase